MYAMTSRSSGLLMPYLLIAMAVGAVVGCSPNAPPNPVQIPPLHQGANSPTPLESFEGSTVPAEPTVLKPALSVTETRDRSPAEPSLVVEAAPVAPLAPVFARHPAVEALPVVADVDSGRSRVTLRGDLSRREAEEAEELARAVYDDVNARFVHGEGPVETPRIDLCVFYDEDDYEDFVAAVFGPTYDHSSMGFYRPDMRLILANLNRSMGNLRHELVHPLIGDDFPLIPSWLNEGLGSLYGSSAPHRGTFRFRVNYRLRDLHTAIEADSVPTFEDLASSGRSEVYGPRSMTYYALARYLLFYLNEADQLEAFYREMWERVPTADSQLELLERYVDYDVFVAWAAELD